MQISFVKLKLGEKVMTKQKTNLLILTRSKKMHPGINALGSSLSLLFWV